MASASDGTGCCPSADAMLQGPPLLPKGPRFAQLSLSLSLLRARTYLPGSRSSCRGAGSVGDDEERRPTRSPGIYPSVTQYRNSQYLEHIIPDPALWRSTQIVFHCLLLCLFVPVSPQSILNKNFSLRLHLQCPHSSERHAAWQLLVVEEPISPARLLREHQFPLVHVAVRDICCEEAKPSVLFLILQPSQVSGIENWPPEPMMIAVKDVRRRIGETC